MARGVGGHGPANIMKHLKGMDSPADKDQILSHAKDGEGPDKQYHSPAEVMKEIGNIEAGTKLLCAWGPRTRSSAILKAGSTIL